MREKINAIAITITTATLFGLWQLAIRLWGGHPWIKLLVVAAFSYGVYRFLVVTLGGFLSKVQFIKRWLLGRDYVDGIWIGAYVGCKLEPRIYYEEYDQQYDSVTVRGRSFLLDGTPHAMWTSTSFNISHDHDKIFFTYNVQSFTEEPTGNGYAQFTPILDRKGKHICELRGFSFDLHNGLMIPSLEKRIDNKPDENEIVAAAKTFYHLHERFFEKEKAGIAKKLAMKRSPTSASA